MKTWLGSSLLYAEQTHGDLGSRMYSAIKRSLHDGCEKTVLIGTDIPGPLSGHIEKAFNALNEKDIVLGPATDGGYWLIGMKEPYDIFKGVSWGKETVLMQTLKLAEQEELTVYMLPPVNDIDTVDDLAEWNPHGDWKNPYVSVIIPVFNEEARIEKVIKRVTNQDAEIIAVDGGSNDKSIRLAEKLGVKIVKSPKGRSLQMNAGTLASSGNNLIFLHADTIVPENYPNLVFETLMDIRPVVGAFRFKTDMDNAKMRFIEFMANLRSRYFNMPYGDQAIFISRADFIRAGAFPDVPVAEDIFLIRRLKKSMKIKTIPENAVTSARRWEKHGFLKTTFVNVAIFLGCYLEIKPEKLYNIYRRAWSR